MPYILLFTACFFLTSCFVESDNSTRFHGSRKKRSGTTERQRIDQGPQEAKAGTSEAPIPDSAKVSGKAPQAQSSSQDEKLIFPFSFKSEHVKIHIEPREEQKKMLISVEPEEIPVSLMAGFSGTVFLKDETDHYLISVSPKNRKQGLFFELQKETANLLVEEGAVVSQGSSLAESAKPILFYVKKDDKLTRLCFSLKSSTNVAIVQDYENHPDCQK